MDDSDDDDDGSGVVMLIVEFIKFASDGLPKDEMFVAVIDMALLLKVTKLFVLFPELIDVDVASGRVLLVVLMLVMFPLMVALPVMFPTNQEKMSFPWIATSNSNHTHRYRSILDMD